MAKTWAEISESYDFNRAALAKQRLQNLRHAGRRVRGARIANLMRAAGLKEEEMDETDLDQLDEVLNADDTASDWIHDFVHSTNPKFEGKSKKERIKMALGAYYSKARAKQQNEEVEKKKKEDLPFDPDPPKKTPPAKAGKCGQGYSTARHLARQGMKDAMKEEFDVDVSDEELDQIVEDVLDALVNKQLEEGAFSSGALIPPKSWLDAAKKIPSKGTIRDKDAKGVYTAKTVNGKEVSRVYDKQNEEVEHTGPVKVKVQADKEAHEEKWETVKKKPVKEQYDEEGNLVTMPKTYQEFMEAMIATKVAPGVTRYTGGSYGNAKGAKYGNTNYDKETLDTNDDEDEETQKRGRGRPAGSKSGARGPRIK